MADFVALNNLKTFNDKVTNGFDDFERDGNESSVLPFSSDYWTTSPEC